jgi:dipeptidyl aminopeptidase/acylaminoacyl peptidase
MSKSHVAPYGSWKSPITSDLIVAGTVRLGEIEIDGQDVYWTEMRPSEAGRYVIVRRTPDGQLTDVTPPPFNARTQVHEYGGGAYTVDDGVIYFSNWDDQRLYRQIPGADPQPITPEAPLRYADVIVDHHRERLLCVREDHSVEGREPVNTIVSLPLDGSENARVLLSGNDFYAAPRISPDGNRLAWLTWNHPLMPWNGTELWVAQLQPDGSLGQTERIAGGEEESIFQPQWSPDGSLYFISDRSGWWVPYRWQDGREEQLVEMEAEFGQPQWLFDMSTYGFLSARRIVCSYTQDGVWHLAYLDPATGELSPIEIPYTEISQVRAAAGRILFLGGAPTEPSSVVQLDPATGEVEVLRRSSTVAVEDDFLSSPEPVTFPTTDGEVAHGYFYPPTNPNFVPPAGERPPLIVISHGGPTGSTSSSLSLGIQYWTSRGFGVLDVDYRGSTGYGRAYRDALEGRWGIVDVDDCVRGARYLVQRGEADEHRLAIRGGSAGGYTTLCALTFRQTFQAGASHFGLSELEVFATDTHKFESRYMEWLIGPYPERRDLYRERSPIHFVDQLACPVIFFQGLEDRVVPPNQAELMVEVLREKGLPVAYLAFEGEQHGFRRAENIKRTLDAELYFYSRIFGFELADPVEPVEIENLPD